MRLKSTAVLLTSAALALGAAACGGDDNSTEELERFTEFIQRVIDVQGRHTERIREM